MREGFYAVSSARKSRKQAASSGQIAESIGPTVLRIIGGQYRNSKLEYHGDRRVRPMKERIREAVFNLLGPGVKGKHAVDLFAGSGALGLEALSRGAARATFIERHFPTAAVVERNIQALGVEEVSRVIGSDTFIWTRRLTQAAAAGDIETGLGPMAKLPWVVFCSPPYDFYVERTEEVHRLLETLLELAPPGSLFAVESDERYDMSQLPQAEAWNVRAYPPAVVAVLKLESSPEEE